MTADIFGSGRKQVNVCKDVTLLSKRTLPKRTETFEPFCFIQAADTQFGLIDRYIKLLEKPGWDEEIRTAEQLVEACNKMEPMPKFIVICGDIIDAYPHQTEIRNAQIKDIKRVLTKVKLDIPLVCVCGNHDVGDEPTLDSVELYKKDFGEDYFYFVVNEILFIVLNSQFYKHREFVKDYAEKQDQWLESILSECKYFKTAIVFQHIPWFLNDPNEVDEYFNVDTTLRLEWLKKFEEAGVSKIMCGHYHRNAGGWFNNKLEVVVTSAVGAQFGSDLSGARLVKILGDGTVKHQYYPCNELPERVNLS